MGGGEIEKLVHPELSYRIVGILFKTQNDLGKGYREKHVQRAVAVAFTNDGLVFREQVKENIEFGGKIVGRYYLDFEVEGKIIVELKVGEKATQQDFNQVKHYLQKTGLPLGLLAYFGRNGVKVHRVLRPH